MPEPSPLADPETNRAFEANIVSFFSRFGRTSEGSIEKSRHGVRVCSGVPYAIFNWVFQVASPDGNSDVDIAATIAHFGKRGTPFYWGVFPNDRPPDLRERLLKYGFVADDAPAMAIDLEQLPTFSPVPELTIRPVRTEADIRTFAQVLNIGDFQASEAIALRIPEVLQPSLSPFQEEPHLGCLVGYRDGVPVATSARFLSDGVTGIYGVATVPEARRRGFGAAMTLAALQEGRTLGFRAGVLVATSMGEPVYRRIGFKEVFRLGQFRSPTPGGAA